MPEKRVIYLVELHPYDPVAEAVTQINFSDSLTDSAALQQSLPYAVRVTQGFSYEIGVFDENIPGGTTVAVGAITLQNGDGEFDDLLNYNWDARQAVVKRGYEGDAYGVFETLFIGGTLEVTATPLLMTIVLRDNSYKLAVPIQNNKYLGTGNEEGPTDLAERRKPLAFGRVMNASAVNVDPAGQMFQVHDGAVEAIHAVYDKGNLLTKGGDHANYAALRAATITPGYFHTCIAEGFFRLGAKPAGTITVDLDGPYSTSAPTLADLAGQVLVDRTELELIDLDQDSLDQLALDHPYPYKGVYLPEPDVTVDSFLETLMAASNAMWFLKSDGKIHFKQFKFSEPVAEIREEDVATLQRDASPSPLHRVIVSWGKNPTIQQLGDFSVPRETLNGYLKDERVYVTTAADGTGGTYTYEGEFEVFLNDEKVNELAAVQFREVTPVSWLAMTTDGKFTISDPGVNSATATLEARIGEFVVTENFTLTKRLSPATSTLSLTTSNRRFTLSDAGLETPSGQTSTVTATGSGLGTLTFSAVDNIGNVIPLTGSGSSRTVAAADLVDSPLVLWVRVTVTESGGLSNSTKIIVQRGEDAYSAAVLGALAAANEAVEIYYQNDAPTTPKTDDLWFDTNDANKLYRWNGTTWITVSDTRIADALTAAAGAQATADGKIKTFFGTSAPTAEAIGDLWYNPNTGILKRWDGATWNDSVGTVNVPRGAWVTGTLYRVGDFFGFNNSAYIVTEEHTSSGESPDFTKVTLLSAEGAPTWNMNTSLSAGVQKFGDNIMSLSTYTGTWTAKFVSIEQFTNTIAAVRASQTNKQMAFGFSTAPSTAGLAAVNFGIQFNADGTYQRILNGVAGAADVTGSYTVNDDFVIAKLANSVVITKNGSPIHTFAGVTNSIFYLAGLMNAASAAMNSIVFIQGASSPTTQVTIYKRSASAPATPTGDNPAGWSTTYPAGVDALWASTGTKLSTGTLVGVWSTPALIAGQIAPVPYAAGTTYYQYQTVTYNGGTYILTVPSSTGNAPSGTADNNSYWNVIAAPGSPGTPGDPPAGFSTTVTITTGTGLINLRALANAAGYTGAGDATVTYNVTGHRYGNPGSAAGTGGNAIETGTWPSSTATIALTLNVNSGVEVRGGGGGGNGGAGGDAVSCQENLTIVNSGAIRGGGGGGGEGAWSYFGGPMSGEGSVPGGGGGGGYPNGTAGPAGEGSYYYDPPPDGEGYDPPPESSTIYGNAGNAGTTSGGGTGGAGVSEGGKTSGNGGTGGGAGAAGSTGGSNSNSQAGSAGGAAGYAVRKNGKTVTNATGTYSGTWA